MRWKTRLHKCARRAAGCAKPCCTGTPSASVAPRSRVEESSPQVATAPISPHFCIVAYSASYSLPHQPFLSVLPPRCSAQPLCSFPLFRDVAPSSAANRHVARRARFAAGARPRSQAGWPFRRPFGARGSVCPSCVRGSLRPLPRSVVFVGLLVPRRSLVGLGLLASPALLQAARARLPHHVARAGREAGLLRRPRREQGGVQG
jgi:hypothetical protein